MALGDQLLSLRRDFSDIGLVAAVALFDRRARVTRRFALRRGLGKGDERAVTVGELVGLRAVDVPPRMGAKWYRDLRQPDAGDLVAVGVDRADARAVDIVDPRRRVDPIDRRDDWVGAGGDRETGHCRH